MIAPFTKSAVLEILRTPAASDTFPDMIRRVEALEGSGVRIKALKWLDGYRPASTPHLYQIWPDNGGSGAPDDPLEIFDGFMLYSPNMMALGVHQTIESAKAAAQADYEARIMAALEPVAQPGPGPGELLPCPFCGGEAVLCKPFAGRPYVACETSFCSGPKDTAEEAIAAWNRRAAREPGTEPTPGQFTTMCLAIEDVVTGRGFDVDPWQPIETAPQDGRWMIGAWFNSDDGCGYCASVVRHAGGGDWREKIGMDCDEKVGLPTHWMPLPKPPGETTSAIPEEVKAYLRNALMVGGWRGERD